MPRRKQVYKITYPNGKVYVGMDLTGAISYFGSPSAKDRMAADLAEHRLDLTARKEILWESETANPTRRKTGPTVMAAPWLTLSGRTAGTIRSKRLARERPTPTCTAVIPLLATLQSRRLSKRQSMRIGVFGVRRAMATRNLFRAEVGAAELTPNTRRTLCFGWLHGTATRPTPRLTLPQCSRRRATR